MQISFVGMYLYTQQHHVMGWGSAAEAAVTTRAWRKGATKELSRSCSMTACPWLIYAWQPEL